ncbi:TPA: DNA repair protein [Vibrio parahaemolyticus]|nr:DNA repair protein [Vibrio parahaemolyticus]HBC3383657.1 DNA repair protein [Vibrio parahaemolyticus]HBC3445836.1 DNA repair protein [Vibrio parahaemolyticus]HBC3845862.1 DNA repair protein [Vibrio parahaemolyticus]HBH7861987.1 DNA repair protein [Vibrio parahaemolyticus]
MRVSAKELYKIGLETLKHYKEEEYFRLYSYREVLRPFLDEYYCTEEHIERFNNQSYRVLKILEEEGEVFRLCHSRKSNAQYVALGGKKISHENHRVDEGDLELEIANEERQYDQQLLDHLAEIHIKITAYEELLSRFPKHAEYIRREMEILERESLLVECKSKIMDKLINNMERN